MRHRVFSILLALALLLTALPVSTLAQEPLTTQETAAITAGGTDTDLFYGYLLRQAGEAAAVQPDNVLRRPSSAAAVSRLTGDALRFYNALKPLIETAADAGGSTAWSIPLVGYELALPVTADQLGGAVPGHVVLTETGSALKLSDAAEAYYAEKLRAPLGQALDALLADCAYSLYWYDKTTGCIISNSKNGTKVSGDEVLEVQMSSLTLYFTVAKAYQDSAAGKSAAYTISEDLIQGAKAAVENAKAIVAKNAEKSDYEKVVAYREEICGLVNYNHAALGAGVSYGDPWQLIYVFDKNDDTDVVCEGYAKAFQYLCDLSEFQSSQVECRTVSGFMSGGTGEGAHMWNIITMDDGENYLVDVTNCDSGSAGAPDKLFLRGGLTGTVSGGYGYKIGSQTISYRYPGAADENYTDQTALWGEANITLFPDDYLPPDIVPVSLTVRTGDVKKDYAAWETFDATGLTAQAVFSDDSAKTVYAYALSHGILKNGDTAVTVSYTRWDRTVTAEIPVTVTPAATTLQNVVAGDGGITGVVACTVENATAYCAFYDNGGRMVSLQAEDLPAWTHKDLQFQPMEGAASYQVMILDSSWLPLCTAAAGRLE